MNCAVGSWGGLKGGEHSERACHNAVRSSARVHTKKYAGFKGHSGHCLTASTFKNTLTGTAVSSFSSCFMGT